MFYYNAFKSPVKYLEKFADGTKMGVLNSVSLFNLNGTMIPAKDLYDNITYSIDLQKYFNNKPIYITESFVSIIT